MNTSKNDRMIDMLFKLATVNQLMLNYYDMILYDNIDKDKIDKVHATLDALKTSANILIKDINDIASLPDNVIDFKKKGSH